MKSFKKLWNSSLSFLEHNVVYSIIIFIVVIYTLGIFDGINSFIGGLYNHLIIRILVIILIIWVTPKDPTLGILLALSYVVSLHNMSTSETFFANDKKKIVSEEEQRNNKRDITQEERRDITQEERRDITQQERMDNKKNSKEHFFPVINVNDDINANNFNVKDNKSSLNKQECMDLYVPQYEVVGNVCDPVATFQGELNPQGLNFPEGFGSTTTGSPLN